MSVPYKCETSSSGWLCPQCSTWVPGGESHGCPVAVPDSTPVYVYGIDPEHTKLLKEIRNLLRSIEKDVAVIKMKYVNRY